MLVTRKHYIKLLNTYKNKDLIKVITGMRRVGKSTLMDLFSLELRQSGVDDSQIQFINFENPLQYSGESWREIFDRIYEQCVPDKMNYIFLDEPQELSEFERLLDGLYIQKNADIYVTGSNSNLLSSELATLLTGRQFEIHVTPFSFLEYLEYSAIDKTSQNFNKNDTFAKFLQTGSLPGMLELIEDGETTMVKYVELVYNSILNRDIFAKHRVNSPLAFENLVKYLAQNIGSQFSANKIANYFKANEQNIDNQTVKSYMRYLNASYILYPVYRFDIKGKRQLVTQEKNYLVDLGIRSSLLGKFPDADVGHLLENVVYFELIRRGYQVWTGKIADKEVDFVAKRDGRVEYFQVAWSVADEKTFDRETSALDSVRNHFRKVLLTTESVLKSVNGIEHLNVIDWLLEE